MTGVMGFTGDNPAIWSADLLENEHGLGQAILIARQRARRVPTTRETIFWGEVTTVLIGRQLAKRA